jgi:acyl-CoA synthetase (AMP-forming)/AMP-acid ligase II
VGVPDDRAGQVPRAFIVPKRPNITEEDIKAFIAAKLSEHKQLKGGVVFLTSIPKNPSGKILRKELRS